MLIPINNVLLVKIEGPVWYTIIIYLLLKGVFRNPFFFDQASNGKHTQSMIPIPIGIPIHWFMCMNIPIKHHIPVPIPLFSPSTSHLPGLRRGHGAMKGLRPQQAVAQGAQCLATGMLGIQLGGSLTAGGFFGITSWDL